MSTPNTLQFHKPSLSEQLELIKKELKGKKLPSIEKYGFKIDLTPIYTEVQNFIQLSPTLSYRLNFQKFSLDGDVENINKAILYALENGVNGLILQVDNSLTSALLESYLKNVILKYINVIFENVNSDSIGVLEDYLKGENPLNICINSDEKHTFSKYLLIKEADFFENCKRAFEELNDTYGDKNIYVNIELNNDFYWNLAKIRAVKTLFSNYQNQENRSGKLIFVGRPTFDYQSEKDIPERNILKLTLSSLAALMATCDGIYNMPFLEEESDFSRRISKNIFNILDEESFVNLVSDVSSGSYYIETYTQEVAKIIYDKISK